MKKMLINFTMATNFFERLEKLPGVQYVKGDSKLFEYAMKTGVIHYVQIVKSTKYKNAIYFPYWHNLDNKEVTVDIIVSIINAQPNNCRLLDTHMNPKLYKVAQILVEKHGWTWVHSGVSVISPPPEGEHIDYFPIYKATNAEVSKVKELMA